MNPIEQLQLRKGQVAVSVFQGQDDGKVLLTIDKRFFGRGTRGPYFTETEAADLAELLQDYLKSDSLIFHAQDRMPTISPLVQQEIDQAIIEARKVCTTPARRSKATMTIMPCIPEYEYVYTCPKCTCHVASNLRVGFTSSLKLCSNCGHVLAARL